MRVSFVGANNPNYRHGKYSTRLYRIWCSMKNRCNNPNNSSFRHYGARGIRVCDDWSEDFQTFYDWALANGYEEHLTLDRIENNGNYEPGNCRWATRGEQTHNTRNSVLITLNGETKTMKQWCLSLGVPYDRVASRINKLGWPPEKALSS